jgi:hypothetical protein
MAVFLVMTLSVLVRPKGNFRRNVVVFPSSYGIRDGGSKFLRNVGSNLSKCTAQIPEDPHHTTQNLPVFHTRGRSRVEELMAQHISNLIKIISTILLLKYADKWLDR